MTRAGYIALAVTITGWCALPAHAYRAFDGTEAAVADKDQFESEFGRAIDRRGISATS